MKRRAVVRTILATVLIAVGAASARAEDVVETFAADPFSRGWRVTGDSSLFTWNQTHQAIDVTWDSSRSNSFLHLPLGAILTKADSFQLSLVLYMRDCRAASTPGKPAEFPIAIGLLNRQMLTNTNAFRGAGVSGVYGVRNIVEWNFFPDAGFGDTWATTVVSSNNVFAVAHNFPVPLINGDVYRVTMNYTASNQVLRTVATRNEVPEDALESVSLSATPDFRVDAFSITSYSDAVQAGSPVFHGSVLAHGSIEEIAMSLPPPPVTSLAFEWSGGTPGGAFVARSNWIHTLERSTNLGDWHAAAPPVAGTGGLMVIRDTNALVAQAFYRVRSELSP